MSLTRFAEQHRLRIRTDADGSRFIPGRDGQVYQYDAGRLAVIHSSTLRKWNARRRAGVAAGMAVLQNGDTEGTLLFDVTNREQCRLAIRMAGVKRKRTMSPAQREVLDRKSVV